jgi:hypothetical protein
VVQAPLLLQKDFESGALRRFQNLFELYSGKKC